MTIADLKARVLAVAALMAGRKGDRISFGVDDEITDAIAALPGAVTKIDFYAKAHAPPYVIESADWTTGDVMLCAQKSSRPATVEEIAAAEGRLHDHVTNYKAGRL